MFIFEEIEDLLADKASQVKKTKEEKTTEKQARSAKRKITMASLGTAAALAYPKTIGRAATKTAAKGGEYVGKTAEYAGKKAGEAGMYAGKKLGKATLHVLKDSFSRST
jgi:predicted hydrocarbon binding protein